MRPRITLVFAAVLCLGLQFSQAQIKISKEAKTDSTERKVRAEIDINVGKDDKDDEKKITYPRTFGGITFSRVDWGFSRLVDNGSFTLSEGNKNLDYKKASNFGFDVAQFGVRFSDVFKVYASAGFEWNYLRLENDILLLKDVTPLEFAYLDPNSKYKKNVFTSTYLRLPLSFELRSHKLNNGKRLKFAFGAMTGVLLKGTQRLKSEEFGKQKYKDTYNLATFQYGGFARIGYDNFGLFTKYYINDMFEKSPAQEGVRNLTFGLTLGF
ncbi:outer membrane beta-barrel protein [Sphingobacterium sp. UBA6645]|uniref:outer membrane beta-barrel protein n=1 Tax=Sphingobacterium sp. UBA6645 TaxID=1947511 RepID=UPI0025E73FD6|nr:outer membrane beta-barrel protein [Sphingobacterium sp. UBA6645]